MLKKIIFFLFSFAFLLAEDSDTQSLATIESDPSAVVECVNVMTGQIYINDTDIISPGKEPIYFGKNYLNITDKKTNFDEIVLMSTTEIRRYGHGGWEHFDHLLAFVDYNDRLDKRHRRLDVYEATGACLSYKFEKIEKENAAIFEKKSKKEKKQKACEEKKNKSEILELHKRYGSFVNTSRGMISARSNYINNVVVKLNEHELKVYCVDGTIRKYFRKDAADKPYYLIDEILPNGNKIRYSYKDFKSLKKIESLDPKDRVYSSLEFDYEEKKSSKKKIVKEYKYLLKTHNGKKIEYKYKIKDSDHDTSFYVLDSVNSYRLNENISYLPHFTFYLNEITHPNHRKYKIDYHISDKHSYNYKKVKQLSVSCSKNKDIPTYNFEYEKGITTVSDANGNITKYYYDIEKFRLNKVVKYQKDLPNPIKTDLFIWGEGKKDGFLLGKVFFDESNTPIKAIKYIYSDDNLGNIEKEITYGDITGKNLEKIVLDDKNFPKDNGVDTFTKSYTYTDKGYIKSEKDQNGIEIEYSYLINK